MGSSPAEQNPYSSGPVSVPPSLGRAVVAALAAVGGKARTAADCAIHVRAVFGTRIDEAVVGEVLERLVLAGVVVRELEGYRLLDERTPYLMMSGRLPASVPAEVAAPSDATVDELSDRVELERDVAKAHAAAAALAERAERAERRVRELEQERDALETAVKRVERMPSMVFEQVVELNRRMDSVSSRVDVVESRLDDPQDGLKSLNASVEAHDLAVRRHRLGFRWLFTSILWVLGSAGVIVPIATHASSVLIGVGALGALAAAVVGAWTLLERGRVRVAWAFVVGLLSVVATGERVVQLFRDLVHH